MIVREIRCRVGRLRSDWVLTPLIVAIISPVMPAQPPKDATAPLLIRGTVVDEKGNPVAGATISGVAVVSHRRDGQSATTSVGPLQERITDQNGTFTVEMSRGDPDPVVNLRARHQDAFTEIPVELRGEKLGKPVVLKISSRNARGVSVRAIDEEGKPVAGATVAAKHQPPAPAPFGRSPPRRVDTPGHTVWSTDAEGRFKTSRCLDPAGSYQLEIKAESFLPERTLWKDMPGPDGLAFGDVVLRRLRTFEGQILDGHGKPVAGAVIVRADSRQRAEGTTDADGRFKLTTAFFPPGFLFVAKTGFRFYGQRCDKPELLKITLTRREEAAGKPMSTQPPALPRAERKKLAAQLLEPYLERVLKGNDDSRFRPLEMVAKLDAGRLLEELDKRPYSSPWSDSYLRRAAAKGLLPESLEEARTIVDSMTDAGFRSTGYVDLYDALPGKDRTKKLELLNQALLHGQNVEANDHRIIHLVWIARRFWVLGEKERATKILREGQAIAVELPTAAWAGYARGAFAEDLALIDLPGALSLMKDLKDPFEYSRHHGNLAHKLAGTNPPEAERIFDMLAKLNGDRWATRICYRMAAVDLPRARRIAERVKDPYQKARAYGVIAQALAKSDPQQAIGLLDQAFELLGGQMAGQARSNNFYSTACVAGVLVPVAEIIDPALVPEFYWRTLSLRPRTIVTERDDQWNPDAFSLGIMALALSPYDHDLAMALIEEAHRHTETSGRLNQQLSAAAIANPHRAAALVEKMPEGQSKDDARKNVADMLLSEGEAMWRAVYRALGQWYVDDEDY